MITAALYLIGLATIAYVCFEHADESDRRRDELAQRKRHW